MRTVRVVNNMKKDKSLTKKAGGEKTPQKVTFGRNETRHCIHSTLEKN